MDCKELMVGDWFKAVDYNSPFRITAIYDDLVQTQADYQSEIDGNWYSEAEIKDLVPIELTEEILVKYWFVLDKTLAEIGTKVYTRPCPAGDLSVKVFHDGSIRFGFIKLTYVHQLQHLLRLAGVQKEIEL